MNTLNFTLQEFISSDLSLYPRLIDTITFPLHCLRVILIFTHLHWSISEQDCPESFCQGQTQIQTQIRNICILLNKAVSPENFKEQDYCELAKWFSV